METNKKYSQSIAGYPGYRYPPMIFCKLCSIIAKSLKTNCNFLTNMPFVSFFTFPEELWFTGFSWFQWLWPLCHVWSQSWCTGQAPVPRPCLKVGHPNWIIWLIEYWNSWLIQYLIIGVLTPRIRDSSCSSLVTKNLVNTLSNS